MPKILVYAVIYDDNKNFIVTKKNTVGYFFGGGLVPKGQPITNGPGSYCFPGGSVNVANTGDFFIMKGGMKELQEETNYVIDSRIYKPGPTIYNGVDGRNTYYGVYFKAPNILGTVGDVFTLKNVHDSISASLAAANTVVAKIATFQTYTQIKGEYNLCPLDNELESCAIMSYDDIITKEIFVKDNLATGWFYEMLINLKTLKGW